MTMYNSTGVVVGVASPSSEPAAKNSAVGWQVSVKSSNDMRDKLPPDGTTDGAC
jgi:hypothetical protein